MACRCCLSSAPASKAASRVQVVGRLLCERLSGLCLCSFIPCCVLRGSWSLTHRAAGMTLAVDPNLNIVRNMSVFVSLQVPPRRNIRIVCAFMTACLQTAHVELKSHMIEVSRVLSWRSSMVKASASFCFVGNFSAIHCGLQVHVPKKNMLDNVLALGCQDIESARVW